MKTMNVSTIHAAIVAGGADPQWTTAYLTKDQAYDAKRNLGFWHNGHMSADTAEEYITAAVENWDFKHGIFAQGI